MVSKNVISNNLLLKSSRQNISKKIEYRYLITLWDFILLSKYVVKLICFYNNTKYK